MPPKILVSTVTDRRGLSVVALLAILATGTASAERGRLAPRHYTSFVTKFEQRPRGYLDQAYSGGRLWVAPGDGGIWVYGGPEKFTTVTLPAGAFDARALWASGVGVTALAGKHMLNVSTSGIVTPVREIEKPFWLAVPVREGYVGMDPGSAPQLVYVTDSGERRNLSWKSEEASPAAANPERIAGRENSGGVEGGAHREKVETRAARADASKGQRERASDDVKSEAPQTGRVASVESSVPAGGVLVPLDPDRVAYVTHEPYQAWIVGIDGTARHIDIDESNVIRPEDSAQALPLDQVLLGIECFRLGKVMLHNDRLVIAREYRKYLELTRDRGSRPKGSQTMRGLLFIDFVDLITGEITERVDVAAIKGAGNFVGFKGDDLVFVAGDSSTGGVQIAVASAD